ncbi:MAG: dihydroorotate dehydrogenase [Deltaproteobacteria bacterium]|nr:dihydroorotate dehydrogenase [Deltaproteobacteria bacterium]
MGKVIKKSTKKTSTQLSVRLGTLELANPVITASGTFGYGLEFKAYMNIDNLGAIITKGLSLKPRKGNPGPRIVETPSGMINAIGLANIGVEAFINEKLPLLKKTKTKIIANIFGETVREYSELAKRLSDVEGVSALEINISCPNVKKGGMSFGTDPKEAARVVRAVRKATRLHVMTKLSPNVSDIKQMVRSVESAGTDSVSLINTIPAMAINAETKRPVLGNVMGGLSGPAIKPVALRMVYEAASVATVPLVGIGGITTAVDAIEFILAGASAVQIGTASFITPSASESVVSGLKEYVKKNGDIKKLIGALKV